MTERAAFEEWAKPRLFNLRRMKDYPDQYLDLSTECGWQAWQAAPNEREARMLTGEERRDVARGMDPAHTTWLLSDWPCARLYSTAVIRKFCEVNGIALAEVAGGDQKAAPFHPSPPFDFSKPCDVQRILSGAIKKGDPLPTMCERCHNPHHACDNGTAVHPSSVQAVDGDEPLRAFDHALSHWAQAYPLTMFPEPDMWKVRTALEAAGITLDSVSVSGMRHVVTTLDELFAPVRAAMKDKGHDN